MGLPKEPLSPDHKGDQGIHTHIEPVSTTRPSLELLDELKDLAVL